MVPDGWVHTSLGGKVVISSGIAPSSLSLSDKGKYPYVKVEDMNNCAKYQVDSRTYTDDKLKLISEGAVIFPKRGAAIMNNKVRIAATDLYLDSNMMSLFPKDGLDGEFLYYLLIREELHRIADTSTIPQINNKHINPYRVMLPPLLEQKKIVQILSTWDKAITTTEQLLANSQQQKQALMQQLLTGKKRLLDKNGVRFSGEWKKGKLSDIANIDSGYAFKSNDFTDSDKGIPIIRMSDFKAGGIDISSAAKVIPESTIGLDRFKLKTGDFVFGMSGSLSNYGWVKEQDLPCFLNQRVGRILAKECAVQLFVTYLYLSDKIQQSILDKAAGAAQLNISSTDLRTTIVHYPSYDEQQKIAAVLSTADQEISALQQKLDALKQEKKALMQQLLTGKRRVTLN